MSILNTAGWMALTLALVAGTAPAQTTFNQTSTTDWNTAGNWSAGVPTNTIDAIIASNKTAIVNSADTPSYTGSLTLQAGAEIDLRNNVADYNALGTGIITLSSNATLRIRRGDALTITNDLSFAGDALIVNSDNATDNKTREIRGIISGSGQFTYSMRRGNILYLMGTDPNTWSGGIVVDFGDTNFGNASRLQASKDGAFGTGNVTVNDGISLIIESGLTNTIDDSASLYLNDRGHHTDAKLVLNASETIGQLFVDGFQTQAGTYTSAASFIGGSGTLTVLNDPVDNTPPTLVSMVDNFYGGPIWENVGKVVYTVTFDEDIDGSTVTEADFENGGSATITIGTITNTSEHPFPAVFTVEVEPSSAGTLQLQIKAGAVIEDLYGNALDTTSPVADDTVITINAGIGPLIDEDFQGIMYPSGTGLPTFYGWSWGGTTGSIKARNAASQADVPGSQALPNQVIQFEWSTWARYDIWHNWSSSDVYDLSVNVSPQEWNGQVQRYFAVKLLQQDNKVLWNSGPVAMPLYDNFGRNPWTELQTFSFTIEARSFATGTPGQPLRFEITDEDVGTGERGFYWDNVLMTLKPPSGTVLIVR